MPKRRSRDDDDDEDEDEKPRRRRSSRKSSSGFGAWLFRTLFLLSIWVGIGVAAFVGYCAIDLPDIHQVVQTKKRPSITLMADDGSIFARFGDLYGDHMSLEELPKYLPEAIIAIEDRRFYQHFGIDVFGILRAGVRNVTAGHLVQGGSTLTQQLAKNLFLTPDRTAKRKVQEMMLAFELEHTYTKNQILTAYINRVYLGSGAYGVDAAAHTYFGKSAHDLTLRESAIIAGLLRAPSKFSPARDPALAMARAKTVLQAMVEEDFVSEAERRAAIEDAPIPGRKPGSGGDGRYFADWVAEQIEPFVEDTSQDLIVKTTLNVNLERLAERTLDSVLSKQSASEVSQGALITLAPDGAVKALVGGRNYNESQFNRATHAKRQPGSSFKPIVYLAAIEQGLRPEDIIPDEPITLGHWSPENFDGKYRGNITVREALAESINTVAVRVFQRAGANAVIDTARALGISSDLEHDPALALGASEVTPLELTGAYASLAAGGRAITPYAITEISNRHGQILYQHSDVTPPEVVNASAVGTLTNMMEDVVRMGTGRRASLGERPVAGKTGTSSDYHDAWFMGFTGDYTTGVWLGNDDNKPMKKITGGSLPAAVWHDYMMEAEAGLPEKSLNTGNAVADWANGVTQDVSKTIGDFISGILGAKN